MGMPPASVAAWYVAQNSQEFGKKMATISPGDESGGDKTARERFNGVSIVSVREASID